VGKALTIKTDNMKQLTIIVLATIALFSCNKTDFDYPAGTVGRSKILYYPAVTTQGQRLLVINQGSTFTDPGVTATLNGQPVQYTTSGTVNTAVPGVYNLTYSARNEQGYSASDWRTVVVVGNDVAANDFSGTYMRYSGGAPFGQTSTWTKVANGVYTVDNPGGAATGYGYRVTAINYQGRNVIIPQQMATDPTGATGQVSSGIATFSTTTPLTYTWQLFAPGYGTAARTFVKE
jgi:hypothetical protein